MRAAASVLVYGSLVVFMAFGAFGLFVDELTVWAGLAFCFVTFLVGGILFLGYAAFRPTMAKVNEVILAGSVAAVCLKTQVPLSKWGADFFWSFRETAATAFVAELLSYGRIFEMDDGTRHFKSLNYAPLGRVSGPAALTSESSPSVFRRDNIDTRIFAEFRRKLSELNLLSVSVTDGYVAFVDDGFLDNLHGFVWVRPGHPPPRIDSEFVEASRLIYLRPLHNGWYYFETT